MRVHFTIWSRTRERAGSRRQGRSLQAAAVERMLWDHTLAFSFFIQKPPRARGKRGVPPVRVGFARLWLGLPHENLHASCVGSCAGMVCKAAPITLSTAPPPGNKPRVECKQACRCQQYDMRPFPWSLPLTARSSGSAWQCTVVQNERPEHEQALQYTCIPRPSAWVDLCAGEGAHGVCAVLAGRFSCVSRVRLPEWIFPTALHVDKERLPQCSSVLCCPPDGHRPCFRTDPHAL